MTNNKRDFMKEIVVEALEGLGGKASIIDISRYIWQHHESLLRNRDDLFFTWQYDMRWAAKHLRDEGSLRPVDKSPKGLWVLAKH